MRGISFKINNDYGKVLYDILYGIDVSNMFWNISQDDIYKENKEKLFIKKNLDGVSFLKDIKNEIYYCCFAKIVSSPHDFIDKVIDGYNDYLNSNAETVILICDSIYVEIYCKNTDDIEVIKNNAIKINCLDIEYITDDNDRRKSFNI
jgi:hypothetical protein